jgi:hypothetical protein
VTPQRINVVTSLHLTTKILTNVTWRGRVTGRFTARNPTYFGYIDVIRKLNRIAQPGIGCRIARIICTAVMIAVITSTARPAIATGVR